MAKISVIIPCYNAGQYIDRCFSSIKNQSFNDAQVIFIDDCSTDATLSKLADLQKKYPSEIVVLRNEKNSGPAVSRNKGIIAATSEYTAFCDCDDWYEPDFLEKMLNTLEKNHADIVFCGYHVADEHGNQQSRPISSVCGSLSLSEALGLEADSLCMLMVKSSIMKETLLPDIRNGEDAAVVPLLTVRSQRHAVLSECLYNYFRRQGSASQKPDMRVVDSLVASFEYTKINFPKERIVELEYIGMKNVLYAAVISLFDFSYDTKKANEIISDFEKDFPHWIDNPYFSKLNRYKQVVLKLEHFRCYFMIRLIALFRKWLVNSSIG
jgi:glycosyltransferase involved in cell wall biosynthesis